MLWWRLVRYLYPKDYYPPKIRKVDKDIRDLILKT